MEKDYHHICSLGSARREIESVKCPDCEARPKTTCHDRYSGTAHNGRFTAYAELHGIDPTLIHERPYWMFPDADKYERWGCFALSTNTGTYSDKPSKTPAKRRAIFRSYHEAYKMAEILGNKLRKCHLVEPMIPTGDGEWLKWSLEQ